VTELTRRWSLPGDGVYPVTDKLPGGETFYYAAMKAFSRLPRFRRRSRGSACFAINVLPLEIFKLCFGLEFYLKLSKISTGICFRFGSLRAYFF
jgi:hypothetical protein